METNVSKKYFLQHTSSTLKIMSLSNVNFKEMFENNSFFQFVSKCYLHIIFIIMFILFIVEFFYVTTKNPDDLFKGDFFAKYVNMSNRFLKQN